MSHYLPAELSGLSNFLLKGQWKSYLLHFITAMLAKDLGEVHSMVGSNLKGEPLIIIDALVLDPRSWSSSSLFLLWSALSWFLLLEYGKAAANLLSLGMYLEDSACKNPGRFSSHVLRGTGPHLHKGSFYSEKLYRLNKIISPNPYWRISVHGCTSTHLI